MTTQEQYDAESDEIVEMIYEDALMDEEPWALESYEYRFRLYAARHGRGPLRG